MQHVESRALSRSLKGLTRTATCTPAWCASGFVGLLRCLRGFRLLLDVDASLPVGLERAELGELRSDIE